MAKKVFRSAGLLSCVVLLFSAQMFAQLSTAALNGVVRDSTGAMVPNARVTLTAVDTAVDHTTLSNNAGEYVFTSLTPGKYTVQASAKGFETKKVSAFLLAVGQTGTIDFTLAVGTESSVVTVEAQAEQLDATSSNLGTVLATKQINELPTNGRNFTSLLSLTPGVVPVSTGQNGSQGGGGFSAPVAEGSSFSFPAVNGQTNRSNFFLTDGLNNFGSILSTYAVPPIIDAIQELKVVSHTDSPEYGSVLGGVVNVVSKTGTNAFHGSAWEYFRNDALDARATFLKRIPDPNNPSNSLPGKKPTFHQNQFGGSLGGPVWIPKVYNGKDKTFFFVAYQGFRYNEVAANNILVPTAAQLAGDETGANQIYDPYSTRPDPAHPGQYLRDPFPGNQIPASRIDQRMVAFAKFVYPTAGPLVKGTNAVDNTPLVQTENEFTARVDQNFGKKDSAWFRYSMINNVVSKSGGLPGLQGANSVPARNWGGSYVHVFGPSLILQLQYARTTVRSDSTNHWTKSINDIFTTVGFSSAFAGGFAANGGGNLLPGTGINGYSDGGESINLTPKATDSHQVSGVLTKILGNHEIRFGGGFISNTFEAPLGQIGLHFLAQQTASQEEVLDASGHPIATGDPVASFLLGVPDGANRRNVNEKTRPGGVMDFFLQDSWKATSKLTVNYGLRYDYSFLPPYGTNDTIGQNGGIETGDMNFANGTYVLQKLPPTCAARGYAPCIPDPSGQLPAHVVVDPRGKIAHNFTGNWGPRLGFSYRLGEKTVLHGGYGIVYDNWAAVSQMAQNIEGSWPDIGQLLANGLNQPTSASPTPNRTVQNPFGSVGGGLFPAATPFDQVQWFYDPNIKNAYSEQWNVGIQRQLNSSTAITANYVGSGDHRVVTGGYYNTALTPGPGDPRTRSLYPYIAPTFYDRSTGTSSYNAAQFQLDKRYSSGLSYSVGYTYSKSINAGGDGWFGAEGGSPVDPYHPNKFGSRSVSGTDLTHVLTENTIFQIPVGKGHRWSTGSGWADYLLGSWQLNNFLTVRSGLPYTPTISSDIANTGNVGWSGYEHANLVGDPHKNVPKGDGFNPAAYTAPAQYTFGTAGRNSLRSAHYINMDASIFRQFPAWEETRFEFRLEAFNLFNHPTLGTPNSDLNNGTRFGLINSTSSTARQLQLGGKFIF
ncbi:TonB-dependent receptor [Edaphobacter bradus]|uniref:TonB-dependent receptor n=1 Tax=Edaphobacter bradus TaxID=2259016 RepID=UPI0021E08567|nr:carboxypeptidase-like regulatory domain-containing protein [Edaphobacter bradus]